MEKTPPDNRTDKNMVRDRDERGFAIMFGWAAEQLTDREYEELSFMNLALNGAIEGWLQPEYRPLLQAWLNGAHLIRDVDGMLVVERDETKTS